VRRIHLIAACGTAMGALAAMLKESGYLVTGSDHKVYPPISVFLAEKGIVLADGFDPANITADTDLVVVGNAVSRDNPEVERMLALGVPYCSMPQALNHFFAAGKDPVVVTGTHGKTTTSAMIAWILHAAGLDPTFMIGGILRNFDSNYRLGRGMPIVLEGDEYDTAFFDKGPKFLHYIPHLAVLTSIEFDHADIFRDLDHVKSAFDRFLAQAPPQSTLIAHDADPNVAGLLAGRRCCIERYGREPTSPWRLGAVMLQPPQTRFEVFKNGRLYGSFETDLPGGHNLLNLLASIAVADHFGISAATTAGAITTFRGAKRRQEIRGRKNGVSVIDDFAHHPTAVRETIQAVKPHYPAGRLIAVFEPRTNSSMRRVFQQDYARAFDEADLICIRQPPLLHKVPADDRFSSRQLVDDLRRRGKAAHFFQDTDAIIAFLSRNARFGDAILVMSNGGFDDIHSRLLEAL
jgi:UDP-N-acetylmuramate: L-alanyl-gamma-D-glutamyl-meso-diaminopimelate ligase